MENYLSNIKDAFESLADDYRAGEMQRYMQYKFVFVGISAGERRLLQRQFIKKHGLPEHKYFWQVINELWEYDEREYQYFALDLMQKHIKHLVKGDIDTIEKLICNKSWWDTVDVLSSWMCGEYFRKFPKDIPEYIDKWVNSGNIWLQRASLLFQLKYKKRLDFELLKKVIIQLTETDEFFIQKAIGWSLREYSKVRAKEVVKFINETTELSQLSRKEALKVIERSV